MVASSSSTMTSKVVPRTEITAVGVRTLLGLGWPPIFSMCTFTRPITTSRISDQFDLFLRKTVRELGKTWKVLPSETLNSAKPSGPVMIVLPGWTESPIFNAHSTLSRNRETRPVIVSTVAAASSAHSGCRHTASVAATSRHRTDPRNVKRRNISQYRSPRPRMGRLHDQFLSLAPKLQSTYAADINLCLQIQLCQSLGNAVRVADELE